MQVNTLILSILIILSAVPIAACKETGSCKRVRIPAAYNVLPVKVRNGKISGKDLDNCIKNHINAHKTIRELKAIGCFKK